MNDGLKPCPFCGGKVEYWTDLELNPMGVLCSHCKISFQMLSLRRGKVFGDAMEQISERWNRRTES